MSVTIAPTRADLDALQADAIAAWHAVDLAMLLGHAAGIRGAEQEFRACALRYHEAAKAREREEAERE